MEILRTDGFELVSQCGGGEHEHDCEHEQEFHFQIGQGGIISAPINCAISTMRKIDIDKIDNTAMKWRVLFTRGGDAATGTRFLQPIKPQIAITPPNSNDATTITPLRCCPHAGKTSM